MNSKNYKIYEVAIVLSFKELSNRAECKNCNHIFDNRKEASFLTIKQAELLQKLVEKENPKNIQLSKYGYYCPKCGSGDIYDYTAEHLAEIKAQIEEIERVWGQEIDINNAPFSMDFLLRHKPFLKSQY